MPEPSGFGDVRGLERERVDAVLGRNFARDLFGRVVIRVGVVVQRIVEIEQDELQIRRTREFLAGRAETEARDLSGAIDGEEEIDFLAVAKRHEIDRVGEVALLAGRSAARSSLAFQARRSVSARWLSSPRSCWRSVRTPSATGRPYPAAAPRTTSSLLPAALYRGCSARGRVRRALSSVRIALNRRAFRRRRLLAPSEQRWRACEERGGDDRRRRCESCKIPFQLLDLLTEYPANAAADIPTRRSKCEPSPKTASKTRR